MKKGTLYIFCGKMASGKTTLAKQIAVREDLTLISEDTLLADLYPGQVSDVSSYVKYSNAVKSAMEPILTNLLRTGTSVVLDFPANTKLQRQWMHSIVTAADAHSRFHYLDRPDDVCKAQLRERASSQPERQATDTDAMFDAITPYFEPPSDDEGFEILYQ